MASGAAWALARKWGARVSGVVTVAVLARELDPADFGLVALAVAFVAVLSVLIDFGVGTYVVQADEVTDEVLDSCFWVGLGLGLAMSLLVFLAAPSAAQVFDEPQLTGVLRALCLVVVINSLSGVQVALLSRQLRFKALTARFLISNAVASVVAVSTALAGAGVWALVAQQVSSSTVGLLLLWRASAWRPGRRVRRKELRTVYAYGARVTSTSLVGQVEAQGLTFLIGGTLGATALGYYSIAGKLSGIFLDLSLNVLGAASFPVFAKYKAVPDLLIRGYLKAVDLTSLLGGSTLALLAASCPVLLPLAFGEQWRPAVAVAVVMSAGAVVHCFTHLTRPLLLVKGREGVILMIALVDSGIALAVCFAMLPFGLLAVVAARSMLLVVVAVAMAVAVVRYGPVPVRSLMLIYLRNLTVILVVGLTTWGVLTLALGQGLSRVPALLLAVAMGTVAGGLGAVLLSSPAVGEAKRLTVVIGRRLRGRADATV